MGWAYYEVNGKPCGYSVKASCEHPGCQERIDRGLAYCCGGMPESDDGCGGYFCYEHLLIGDDDVQRCPACHEAAP